MQNRTGHFDTQYLIFPGTQYLSGINRDHLPAAETEISVIS